MTSISSEQASPAGFSIHTRLFFDPRATVRLLVPQRIKDEIDAETARMAAQAALADSQPVADAKECPASRPKVPSPPWWASDPDLKSVSCIDGVLRVAEPPARPLHHRIFKLAEIVSRLDELQVPAGGFKSYSNKERDREIFLKLKAKGPLRRLACPRDWKLRLDRLEETQPQFAPVIAFVRGRFALATASRLPVLIPPLLLVGAPGVGKTYFSLELAKALGTTARRHPMDSADTSAALMGSHKSWSGTTIGLVFDEVCLGRFANPVVTLDELDKAASQRYGNPVGPLHTLLEPVSAAQVRDLSLDFEFDASYITWVATANNLHEISEPLRSRFLVFEIPLPTKHQALTLARHVAHSTVSEAKAHIRKPNDEIVAAIAHLAPRDMRKAINAAIGRALLSNRRVLSLADLPTMIETVSTSKVAMGFGTGHARAKAVHPEPLPYLR